jgi:hypothetical protein
MAGAGLLMPADQQRGNTTGWERLLRLWLRCACDAARGHNVCWDFQHVRLRLACGMCQQGGKCGTCMVAGCMQGCGLHVYFDGLMI